jgi:hypothetical protein
VLVLAAVGPPLRLEGGLVWKTITSSTKTKPRLEEGFRWREKRKEEKEEMKGWLRKTSSTKETPPHRRRT